MAGPKEYQALWVEETAAGQFTRRVAQRSSADLPEAEVLVRVHYSSLNYKDALSASGNRGVTRKYPHQPGIDAAGEVEESQSDEFKPGEQVLVVAQEMGASSPGGFGQYVRVPADWVIRLPAGFSARQSMVYGTAGLTAAMCVARLEKGGVEPGQGEILVTGATGGVGTTAVGILAKEGFQVVAATGKPAQAVLLRELGATEVIQRDEVNDASGRPLLSGRWAGVVDTVGGNYLSTAIRSTKPGGVVTACGNAASPELPITVFPFILRGVSLVGIDALLPDKPERERLWAKLAGDWRLPRLEELAREVLLEQLSAEIDRILRGGQIGRVVVNLDR